MREKIWFTQINLTLNNNHTDGFKCLLSALRLSCNRSIHSICYMIIIQVFVGSKRSTVMQQSSEWNSAVLCKEFHRDEKGA